VALATIQDLEARLRRPLEPDEAVAADVLLGDVEAMLRRRIPDLDDRVCDPSFRTLVVMVEASAVLRVLRNPEGLRSETEGNYSYQLNGAVAAGHLFVMDSEWQLLGVTAGAFTITPYLDPEPVPPLNWWEINGWERGRSW
jgi:hypothetical protein